MLGTLNAETLRTCLSTDISTVGRAWASTENTGVTTLLLDGEPVATVGADQTTVHLTPGHWNPPLSRLISRLGVSSSQISGNEVSGGVSGDTHSRQRGLIPLKFMGSRGPLAALAGETAGNQTLYFPETDETLNGRNLDLRILQKLLKSARRDTSVTLEDDGTLLIRVAEKEGAQVIRCWAKEGAPITERMFLSDALIASLFHDLPQHAQTDSTLAHSLTRLLADLRRHPALEQQLRQTITQFSPEERS